MGLIWLIVAGKQKAGSVFLLSHHAILVYSLQATFWPNRPLFFHLKRSCSLPIPTIHCSKRPEIQAHFLAESVGLPIQPHISPKSGHIILHLHNPLIYFPQIRNKPHFVIDPPCSPLSLLYTTLLVGDFLVLLMLELLGVISGLAGVAGFANGGLAVCSPVPDYEIEPDGSYRNHFEH